MGIMLNPRLLFKSLIYALVEYIIILIIISCHHLVLAQPVQRVEMPSSPNPVGSGARALGMGGAFMAVADDATAASWNPGGLIQLERPEVSAVGAYVHRTEDSYFGTNPEASGEICHSSQDVYKGNLNYLSATYPFVYRGYEMILALNYQHLYDFTRQASFPLEIHADTTLIHQEHDYRMEGGLSAIGLAWCLGLTPRFSCGLTLNLWPDGLDQNKWKQRSSQRGSGTEKIDGVSYGFTFENRSQSQYSLKGFNANIGFLWDLNNQLTLGAVFKTPFRADLTHEYQSSEVYDFADPSIGSPTSTPIDETYHEKLDLPMSYGFGLAYRFSDALTIAFDLYRTEWDDFILTDDNGHRTSPITLESPNKSKVEATMQVRMGTEYLFIRPRYVIPVRCGLFYDPAPAEGSPDDYYGCSFGTGLSIDRYIFDLAYQYRFGHQVNKYMLKALDFAQDIHEHTVYSSLIIHF